MRDLGQPRVLKSAGLAALISSAACYPWLTIAPHQRYPVWYLEAVMFLGGTVLWGFVFAWHAKYLHRPVLTFKLEPAAWALGTLCSVAAAILMHGWVDPAFRSGNPEEFPATLPEWFARTLFSLGFAQLFLIFAPLAWLARLFGKKTPAIILTVLFGVLVMVIKNERAPVPVSSLVLTGRLLERLIAGTLAVYFYLRGGALLVCWCDLLISSRHLLSLPAGY
jgi:hypothetical protein